MPGLIVKNLTKSFDRARVIEHLSFEVREGEFCVLLGPSGCGKSTALRLIAGLEEPDEGTIHIGEEDVTGFTPRERDVAMVFQSYALYPHMNVYDNLAFPLKMHRLAKNEIRSIVEKTSNLLGIGGLLGRKPAELSGGQRQRVAMGRAIVRRPKLFLFDEPLSNLDAKLRATMRLELTGLHQKLGTTMLYVTHDQVEAMTLAHKIILLNEGRIQQEGAPMELYAKPANVFVATFLGSPQINLIEGRLAHEEGKLYFKSEDMSLEVAEIERLADFKSTEVTLGIRPENISLGKGPLKGTIEVIEHLGSETLVYIRTPSEKLLVIKTEAFLDIKTGSAFSFKIDISKSHFFHKGTRI